MIPIVPSLPVAATSAPASAADRLSDSPLGRKLMAAAQEFEANLLTSWWQEAEKGLKEFGGGELGSGVDGLKDLAMNKLAMNTVKSGGVGIARTIFHALEPALQRSLGTGSSAISGGVRAESKKP